MARDVERTLAVDPFVQRDAEPELVRGGVDEPSVQLLGGHVGRSAHDRADLRDRRPSAADARCGSDVIAVDAGKAEVSDLDLADGPEQDVVRLEVAVDEAGRVRGREAAGGAQEALQHDRPWPGLLPHPCAERAAVEQRHDQVDQTVDRADVEDRHHVGVAQASHGLGLPQDAFLPDRSPGVADQLDGQRALELGIAGAMDHAHPAGADDRADLVAPDARERRGHAAADGVRVGHRRLGSLLRVRAEIA